MSFDFLASEFDRQKFDLQIDELLTHTTNLLDSRCASIVLTKEEVDFPHFFSNCLKNNDESFQEVHQKFGLNVVSENKMIESKSYDVIDESIGQINFKASSKFIGSPILIAPNDVMGAIIVEIDSEKNFSEREKYILGFISISVAELLKLRKAIFEIRTAKEEELAAIQNLRETEEKFSALAINVPGAIYRYIRELSGEEAIECMSPGCTELWGYTAEEIERNPSLLWNAVLQDDFEGMRASVQQSQDKLAPWQHRLRIRTKQGFLKWIQGYGTPYRTESGGVAWNSLMLDVTVEQDAQIALAENIRLLHEAQKLESIGRLAGGVAHDFNNLLAVILGNVEAMNRAQLQPEEQECLSEIIEASQRGAVLVKQLLSFARRSDLRAATSDIQQVLIATDRLLRRVLPANISLEIVQRAGLWPVGLDKNMFESALLNIVINARDAMDNGGAITIETSNVRIDDEYIASSDEDIKPGRYVMVAVTDTGSGIDSSTLPFVFEPFFSTKGPSDGSGLGLAMVQGFVKQSGGVVSAYSEPGCGASIKMYFPVAELLISSDKSPNIAPPNSIRNSATVLLAEDQDHVRVIVEKTLKSAGYKVISVNSGDQAFDTYEKIHEDIDIIVTDVIMPGRIQGPQLVRLARKINNNLPVLFMSGYPHEANVHGNGIRAQDISLMKPIRRHDLLTAIAKLLR